jgi:hypothetical protein
MGRFSFEHNRQVLALSAVAVIATLSACGGGGSSTSGNSAQNSDLSNTFPNITPKAGDYYVFQETITAGAGFTAPTPSVFNFTRIYASSAPIVRTDLSGRSDGTSTNFEKSTRNFDATNKETGYTFGTTSCSYSPAWSFAPAAGAPANSTFSATSVRTCGTAVDNFAATGNAVGLEEIMTAAGSFKAFKYTATRTQKNSTTEFITVGTFWQDAVTGRLVKYVMTTKSSAVGSTVITGDNTFTGEVISYSAGALGATTVTVKRFSGGWTVPFTGSATGSCTMVVAATGAITGSCSGSGGISTASGSVTDAGAISVNLTDGSRITGNLTSAGAGNGTWSNGTATGTWTATHR